MVASLSALVSAGDMLPVVKEFDRICVKLNLYRITWSGLKASRSEFQIAPPKHFSLPLARQLERYPAHTAVRHILRRIAPAPTIIAPMRIAFGKLISPSQGGVAQLILQVAKHDSVKDLFRP